MAAPAAGEIPDAGRRRQAAVVGRALQGRQPRRSLKDAFGSGGAGSSYRTGTGYRGLAYHICSCGILRFLAVLALYVGDPPDVLRPLELLSKGER